jgi:PII-like signaling protein
VVDESGKIEEVLPEIEELVSEGLITVDPVQIVYYGHSRKSNTQSPRGGG